MSHSLITKEVRDHEEDRNWNQPDGFPSRRFPVNAQTGSMRDHGGMMGHGQMIGDMMAHPHEAYRHSKLFAAKPRKEIDS